MKKRAIVLLNGGIDSAGPVHRGGNPGNLCPGHNTIFISYILAWAEVLESDDVFIGANAIDYSGYPI